MWQPALGVFLSTFREARRQKIFWVISLGGLFSVLALLLFPAVNEADRARFLATGSLALATVTAGLALLFLAAPSAAREAEERTLHQVLVKPASRFALFAGRVFAYGAIAVLLLFSMGISSFLLLRVAIDPVQAPESFLLFPHRVIEASSLEISGTPTSSKDWEVPRWLAGQSRLVYEFDDLSSLAATKNVKLLVAFPGSVGADHQSMAQVQLRLLQRESGREWRMVVLVGQEEKLLEVDPAVFQGPVRVEVYPVSGAIGLGGHKWPERVGLRFRAEGAGSLLENWLGAFLRRGLALFVLCAIAFLASVLMNGKLALALSLVLFMAGSYPGYLRVMGRMIRGEVTAEHSHSGNEMAGHAHEGHEGEQGEKEGPPKIGTSILAYAADGLASVVPDLDRFDTAKDLVSGYNISSRKDLELLAYLGLYLAATVFLGGLALSRREWK